MTDTENSKEAFPDFIPETQIIKTRLRGVKFGLTYMNIRDIDPKKWYEELSKLVVITKFVCGFELAPTTNTPHYHIGIWLKTELDTTNMEYFTLFNVHPNICRLKLKADWERWGRYCIKGGEESNYLQIGCKFDGIANLVKKIVEQPSAQDALINCANSLKEVVPIIQIYNNRNIDLDEDLEAHLATLDFREGWQKDTYNMLCNTPDRRTVNWYWETTGGVGKSTFCDIMEYKFKNDVLVIADSGSMRDIADIMKNHINSGKKIKYLIMDIPRSFEERDSIYTVLESVKNGRVTCTKYKGQTLRFLPPHVIVFANFKPKKEKMSEDRWNIVNIH